VVGAQSFGVVPAMRFAAVAPGIRERFRHSAPAAAWFAATCRVSFPKWRAYPAVSVKTFVTAWGCVDAPAKTGEFPEAWSNNAGLAAANQLSVFF